MKRFVLMAGLLLLASCGGGGGGGGSERFYGGIWDYYGVKAADPCGVPVPDAVSSHLTVNQNESIFCIVKLCSLFLNFINNSVW